MLLLQKLRPFVPVAQFVCLGFGLIGEEKESFANLVKEMNRVIDNVPKALETQGQGNTAVAQLHYCIGGCDWFITEIDKEGGNVAFGLAVLHGDWQMAELGSFFIAELIECGVELDLHWKPQSLAQIIAERGDDHDA